jgi:dihydrofolate reductase
VAETAHKAHNPLFLQISVSLDGFIEDRDHDIEWMVNDTSLDALSTATLRSIDGMIFGRKAHELLAKFWPAAGDTPGASAELIEQARLMHDLPKYVLTHGNEPADWTNSHTITVDDVPRMKTDVPRQLAVFAGASAAQSLLARDLIDEIRLIVYPVLLGGGTRLFTDDGPRRDFTLISIESFESGATLQCFLRRR